MISSIMMGTSETCERKEHYYDISFVFVPKQQKKMTAGAP
jgi:hypothetical protein